MAHDLFLEEGGYFCFCHVAQQEDGTWHGWVNFERKLDHDAKKSRIPGFRHAVPGTFPDESSACVGCSIYAQEVVAAGEVGL